MTSAVLEIHRQNILTVLECAKQYHEYLVFDRINMLAKLPDIIKNIGKAVDVCIKTYSTHPIDTTLLVETVDCKILLNRIHVLLVDREFKKLYVVPHAYNNNLKKYQQFDNTIRSHHDRFFDALGIKRPGIKFVTLPTDVCTSFLKGITYFDTDLPLEEQPFYHRPDSCGTKKLPAEAKFAALTTNADIARKKKKTASKLCYIERLIYDAIFTNIRKRQDLSHLDELRRTERIYQDYYRSESISVQLQYDDTSSLVPVKLIITTVHPNRLMIDTYDKSWASDKVHCLRTIVAGLVVTKYHKMQTTEKERPWIFLARSS
jgi:hypothetical protein